MGLGMAITNGVSMNDTASWLTMGGLPSVDSRWFTMAPQLVDAGDQISGCSPSSAGQPRTIASAAPPDALEYGRTKAQPPSMSASSDPLKSWASAVMRSIFSDDTAMSTTAQSPGSPNGSSEPLEPPSPPPHAVATRADAARTANARTGRPNDRRRREVVWFIGSPCLVPGRGNRSCRYP